MIRREDREQPCSKLVLPAIARNPRRLDRNPGSFKVNLVTGRWADFAATERGASGGDPVSLAAYLGGLSQVEAARRIACMLRLKK